jgi:hypothetical protein
VWHVVEIREVKSTRQLAVFCNYPIKLYDGVSQFVPDLVSEEKRMFQSKKTTLRLNFAIPSVF